MNKQTSLILGLVFASSVVSLPAFAQRVKSDSAINPIDQSLQVMVVGGFAPAFLAFGPKMMEDALIHPPGLVDAQVKVSKIENSIKLAETRRRSWIFTEADAIRQTTKLRTELEPAQKLVSDLEKIPVSKGSLTAGRWMGRVKGSLAALAGSNAVYAMVTAFRDKPRKLESNELLIAAPLAVARGASSLQKKASTALAPSAK